MNTAVSVLGNFLQSIILNVARNVIAVNFIIIVLTDLQSNVQYVTIVMVKCQQERVKNKTFILFNK